MDMQLKDIAIDIRRRAAQHLESLRGSDLADASADVVIGDSAAPIHRPDREGIAYYEFRLVRRGGSRKSLVTASFEANAAGRKSRKAATATDQDAREAAHAVGFIIASADRHDLPIAHWSLDRLPPSVQVLDGGGTECDCDDAASQGKPARLYKLDALSYVAEDDSGRLLGSAGQRPALLTGLPHAIEKHAGHIASSVAQSVGQGKDDLRSDAGEHAYERKEVPQPELGIDAEETDWESYKKRYADAFGPLLDALRTRAGRVWELEDAIAKYGEGILTGTRHRVALLGEASIDIQGEGAKLVRASIEDNPAGPPTLVIHALAEPVSQETDLSVSIRYANGEHERLPFFLVSRDTPTNGRDDKSGHCECED